MRSAKLAILPIIALVGCTSAVTGTDTPSAEAPAAAATKNIVLADLDSFLDFDDSPLIASAFGFEAPWIHLTEAPGLGVELV
ncbi:MAG: hypothetical protein LBR58_09740 [Propionibacteriaceae bacterium]|jgi:L-alanine-DL-glutamate epimerase-like enolase superfamily enzyme|nr:hypothetical protein [Propionibacteriaceae bacterium]